MIQQQIFAGKLSIPVIKNKDGQTLAEIYGMETYSQIEKMFEAMWYAYLNKGSRKQPNGQMTNSISLPYWAKRINNPKAMNQALMALSRSEWITVLTKPNNNWSEAWLNEAKLLQHISKTDLDHVRKYNKFSKYKLTHHDLDQDFGANKMKVNGKLYTVDYACNGFAKAGKVPFKFDTKSLSKHFDTVLTEVNKGIEKMIIEYPTIIDDHSNYKEIGLEVLQSLMYEDGTYNSGPRTSDPRHRNNAGYLNKIANPIGFKVMRGLLTIPEQYRNKCTPKGLRNKYLFIAELVGFKSGSVESKVALGRESYINGVLTESAVENIWLTRLYEDLNNAFGVEFNSLQDLIDSEEALINMSNYKWQVPIEIDMSASVLGYIGLLLNHKPFLDRCNITQGNLSDAWGHPIITNRKQFKTIMRQCYGSQLTPQAMWDDMNKGKTFDDPDYMHYNKHELEAFNKEMESGEIAVAIAFKDFIIDNCRMQPTMKLNVLGDKVTTYCNKFYNVGETTSIFDLYDTESNSIRRIHNTETKRVPDLKSFKRYSVTGLIHGLDGRVMDNTVDQVIDIYKWAKPIHDAIVLCCESADFAREVYANGTSDTQPSLKYIHTNRNKILSDYFTSLNIPASKVSEWKTKVVPLIQPLEEELIINPLVLK